MRFMLVGFLFFGVVAGGVIWLQIYLSKMESKWPGLVLPAISVVFSLIMVLSMAAYSSITVQETLPGGEVATRTETAQLADLASLAGGVIVVFMLSNIPTAVLLAIYGGCRARKKRNAALDKMSAQDLE